jgi:hypothetical protein
MRMKSASTWLRRDTSECLDTAKAPATAFCAIAVIVCALSGCSSNSGGGPGKTNPDPGKDYVYLTGNWEIQATSTAGTAPFSALAGFINEQGQNPGVDDLTTAALQVQPSSCYVNATSIPLQGSVQAADISLLSFPVNGQVLTIKGTKDATATHVSGS